jgi:hypothetical protein
MLHVSACNKNNVQVLQVIFFYGMHAIIISAANVMDSYMKLFRIIMKGGGRTGYLSNVVGQHSITQTPFVHS